MFIYYYGILDNTANYYDRKDDSSFVGQGALSWWLIFQLGKVTFHKHSSFWDPQRLLPYYCHRDSSTSAVQLWHISLLNNVILQFGVVKHTGQFPHPFTVPNAWFFTVNLQNDGQVQFLSGKNLMLSVQLRLQHIHNYYASFAFVLSGGDFDYAQYFLAHRQPLHGKLLVRVRKIFAKRISYTYEQKGLTLFVATSTALNQGSSCLHNEFGFLVLHPSHFTF